MRTNILFLLFLICTSCVFTMRFGQEPANGDVTPSDAISLSIKETIDEAVRSTVDNKFNAAFDTYIRRTFEALKNPEFKTIINNIVKEHVTELIDNNLYKTFGETLSNIGSNRKNTERANNNSEENN